MSKLEKMRILTIKNSYNLDAYYIIELLLVVRNVHIIIKDQDKFLFYINNYINFDQFNQLYDFY